ncbi:MAG: reprolysin-like metallopeptidase [Methylomonas sp.]
MSSKFLNVKFVKSKRVLTIVTALISTPLTAAVHPANDKIKVPPTPIYQAIHGQLLQETLANVAQRSGIGFKINTDLGNDVVSQSIAADNWSSAVKALLVNYNYTLIQDGDTLKTVIVTGRKNGAGQTDAPVIGLNTSVNAEGVIVVERKLQTLPDKYKAYPAGAVTPVKLPVSAMLNIKDKSTVALNLPMGQFNVTHDTTVNEANGTQTWVGHLADEGEGYRMYMSQSAAGPIMGWITTPDGNYDIQSNANGNNVYIVNNNMLQHAGFEGDTVAMDLIEASSSVSSISQLQAAVTEAQTALNTANAQVTADQTALSSAQSQLSAAQANLAAANSQSTQANAAFMQDLTAYFSSPSMAAFQVLIAAENAMKAATAAVSADQNATLAANSAYAAANANLAAATAAAATALANYNQAQSALTAAEAAQTPTVTPVATVGASNPNPGTTTPVVDLMVVYTTAAYTQAYALQRIQLLVTASNQAYVDSDINMTLRLVHTQATSYVESNSNSQALSDLANGAGAFAGISQTRAQYGADVVFLFRPLYAKTAGSCGTTLLGFAGGQAGNPAIGYGTIGDGNSVDEPGYYCGSNSFTHEIGHSLGLVHDRPNANSPGVFPYAYAWGVNGAFGTIMSYDQPMLMYFSTPLLATQCAGQPCGYAQNNPTQSSDQTSSVNYTAPIVANFMTNKWPLTVPVPASAIQ